LTFSFGYFEADPIQTGLDHAIALSACFTRT
jgi:hypothetical protein